ncbi:hypothetical protein [Salinimicrobium xinjiangense]|uniref:hypothetical protein n=1 Tax=Salinimicrobium xinjiangense TaxID=438596 RepID=UPI000491F3E3|nr:hypothetical protein [Salinimicrobium xinjiangense]
MEDFQQSNSPESTVDEPGTHYPSKTNYLLKRPYFLKYFQYKEKTLSQESIQNNNSDYYNPEIELSKLILADTLGLKNDEEFKMVLANCIAHSKIMIQFYENFILENRILNNSIEAELARLRS